MTKFVFIIPDSTFLIDAKVIPFLGPLYLSAVVKQNGCESEVIDLSGGVALPKIEADYIGITATTPQFPEAVKLVNKLKARDPAQKVIIGGPHASVSSEECKKYFDSVCIGEGENWITAIVVSNLFDCNQIENLDSIPFPDREAIDHKSYHYYIDGKPTTNIITSRGCPYNCAFCCKAPWGRRIRFRSAENVTEEIELLHEMGYEGVMLYDDEFFLNPSRDAQISAYLGEHRMVWRCFSRADVILAHQDIIKNAAKNGLKEILIGCESGSNQILKGIHKGTTAEMNVEAIEFLKSLGVRVKAALIVGLPGESPATINETEKFCEKVHPDVIDFTVLRVMPGSDIWLHPEAYDVKFTLDYQPYKTKPGEYTAGVRTSSMTAKEIVEARDRLDKKFNPHLWKQNV